MIKKQSAKILFLIGSFFVSFCSCSQCNTVLIDSLNKALKTTSSEIEKFEIIKELGTAHTECGYYVKGLEYYLNAFPIAEKLHDTSSLCILNNNVAIIYHETNQKKQCLEHARRAVFFGEKQKNKSILADGYNTLGNYYYQIYQDSLSLNYFNLSLQNRILAGDKLKTSAAYNNLGDIYYEIGNVDRGIALVKKALTLRQSLNNQQGVSSSYESLGEMYLHVNKLDSSLFYFNKFKALPTKNKSLYVQKSFYESYSDLCHKLKMYDSSYLYQKKFIKINDSILNIKSMSQFAEMQTKYETEKKETLLKLSGLELEKLKQKSFYTAISFMVALFVIILVALLLYYRYKSKQKIKLEAEMRKQEALRFKAVIESLEKERGRIAGELHDNSGALISFIITKTDWLLNNAESPEDGLLQIKDSAQEVMTSLRETLWTLNNKTITSVDLIDKLKVYIKKHLLMHCKYTEQIENEIVLQNDVVLSLYRCVQEIINNINKHSRASEVTVSFTSSVHKKFGVVINDNGIGFNTEQKEDNYGIRNLKNRMNNINASLLIESKVGEGTWIEISYP